MKIHYDVGLGREFSASELVADKATRPIDEVADFDNWRISRAAQPLEGYRGRLPTIRSPAPIRSSRPTTRTGAAGAFRAPNTTAIPQRIEFQARIIEAAPT